MPYLSEEKHSSCVKKADGLNIMPEGEDIRKAVQWISSCLKEDPAQPRGKLIDQALFKFDLSPLHAEFLMNFFRKKGTDG